MTTEIAILIPCFNEALTIAKVIQDFQKVLPKAQIYVYDNNSTDQTSQIALAEGAIVRKEIRQGKGNVIRSMFRDIDADIYLMIDGDDTYPAENASELVAAVENDKIDMVIGDRLSSTYFAENKRLFHNFGNKIVRLLINKLFKSNIHDIMTGYRAFSKQFVKTFPVLSHGFEIETEMTIHALDKNMLIREIPVQYRDRPAGGESKLNTFGDGSKVLLKIFNLFREFRPLLFFAWISLITLLIGVGFSVPILAEYFQTGLVPRIPTLIVSILFIITAVLALSTGLILDLVAKKYRQMFELELNRWAENR